MPWGSNSPPPPFIHELVAIPNREAQPFVAADGPPALCKFNPRHGPPQNNTLEVTARIANMIAAWLKDKLAR